MNKKISIIMGIYNCESTIAEAINSIINQTYSNWELIMCDDGSSDRTYEIARKFYLKFPKKIKLLKNDNNMRLAATLNKCLKYASGDYIARMDADDISLPVRLEKQLKFLEDNEEFDCVGSNMIINNGKDNTVIRKMPEYPTRKTLLKTTPFAHPTIMARKSVYSSLGGYTVSTITARAEDLDFWFRFMKHGYRGYNIQENLYIYKEEITDLKKRTISAAFKTSKVFIKGYRLLQFPVYDYIFALRPIIVALLPNKIIINHHSKSHDIK